MACTNRTLPILDKPTRNEQALWTWLSQGCLDFSDPCIIPPILNNPNECELALINAIVSGQCKTQACSLMLSFPPGCSPNLEPLKLYVDDVLNPVFDGRVDGCGPTGLPLSISTLDPNQLGEANGEITCNTSLPEIRLTAAGGVSPYTWSINNPLDLTNCPYGGVGGPSFGPPTADGVCNSRFVITAPANSNPAGIAYTNVAFSFLDVSGCTNRRAFQGAFQCDDDRQGSWSNLQGAPLCGPTFFSSCNNGTQSFPDCNCDPCLTTEPSSPSCDCFLPTGVPCNASASTPVSRCLATCPCPNGSNTNIVLDNCPATNKSFCDIRTQAQQDNKCCPCKLAFANLIVTVTDAIGTMVSITINPNG